MIELLRQLRGTRNSVHLLISNFVGSDIWTCSVEGSAEGAQFRLAADHVDAEEAVRLCHEKWMKTVKTFPELAPAIEHQQDLAADDFDQVEDIF